MRGVTSDLVRSIEEGGAGQVEPRGTGDTVEQDIVQGGTVGG